MRLPNASLARLDIVKLAQYCLSEDHPLGRHKARVFKATLGIEAVDAGWLRNAILGRILVTDAEYLDTDVYGTRYRVDLLLARHGRQAVVRTIWILEKPDAGPRFITCWVF